MILPHDGHCIDMTASPTALPARGCHALQRVIGWALSWTLPALWHHDHNIGNQKMVVLPIIGVDLPCLRKKIRHLNTMLMKWKVCKFKDEDLKSLGR